MNKIQCSKKEMRENNFVVSCGYCNAQNLMRYEQPVAYSVGIYGWACDYYDMGGFVMSTGYSPIGASVNEIVRKYDAKAAKLLDAVRYDYEKGRKICRRLIEAMKREILAGRPW